MKETLENLRKDTQSALKDITDFSRDATLTMQKASLKATQSMLDGYSDVVQQALNRCETDAGKKARAAK